MKDIGKLFMEYTKYRYLESSDKSRGVPQPPAETEYNLPGKIIKLPKPETLQIGDMPIRNVIGGRKSLREYSDVPLTLDELSYLLWCTQGVREVIRKNGEIRATFRNVPSAGARHAFDTYLLINRVEGLQSGLYIYLALEHKLAEVNMDPEIAENLAAACCGQGFVKSCNATFFWAAVSSRMTWRYVERGYRYLFLDAGHVCQNLYISAESIHCGACAVGAFSDEELNQLLELDGVEQFVIYAAVVGRK